jgi:hypothetical protein
VTPARRCALGCRSAMRLSIADLMVLARVSLLIVGSSRRFVTCLTGAGPQTRRRLLDQLASPELQKRRVRPQPIPQRLVTLKRRTLNLGEFLIHAEKCCVTV